MFRGPEGVKGWRVRGRSITHFDYLRGRPRITKTNHPATTIANRARSTRRNGGGEERRGERGRTGKKFVYIRPSVPPWQLLVLWVRASGGHGGVQNLRAEIIFFLYLHYFHWHCREHLWFNTALYCNTRRLSDRYVCAWRCVCEVWRICWWRRVGQVWSEGANITVMAGRRADNPHKPTAPRNSLPFWYFCRHWIDTHIFFCVCEWR